MKNDRERLGDPVSNQMVIFVKMLKPGKKVFYKKVFSTKKLSLNFSKQVFTKRLITYADPGSDCGGIDQDQILEHIPSSNSACMAKFTCWI
jgi:hypothetical protein